MINDLIKTKILESSSSKEIKEFLLKVLELEVKAYYDGTGRYSYNDTLRQLIGSYTNKELTLDSNEN